MSMLSLESSHSIPAQFSIPPDLAIVPMFANLGITLVSLFSNASNCFKNKIYRACDLPVPYSPTKNVSPAIPDIPMVVATNKKKMHGFRVVLNDTAMKDISDRFGGDFYVIPSSIHEIIAVSTDYFDKKEDIQAIKNMIYEINRTKLEDQDFLSDELYAYDSEEMELVFAKELQDRRIAPER